MMYWYLNTETNKPEIFKNLKAVAENTPIEYNALTHQFSRLKVDSYTTGPHRIEKRMPIKNLRKV